jgi:hypothetical protein
VKTITLFCNNYLLNNLPEHIEKLFIIFFRDDKLNNKVENIPITIKEIVVVKNYEKYIKKPFGTILTIK